MGGDNVSARNAGIPTDRLTIALFMSSGFCAAFVGMSPGDPLQQRAGCRWPVLHLQLDHRGGHRRRAAHRRLRLGGRHRAGHDDLLRRQPGDYYTGFDANWASLIIGVLLLLAVLMNNTFRNMALAYAPRAKTRAS